MRAMLALLALATLTANAAEAERTVGPTIELPQVVVTDSRDLPPPESWRYARDAHFEILTNASDRATQRLLEDFALFRLALNYVWPTPAQPRPTTIIVCGKGNKFEAFAPGRQEDPTTARASLFLKGAVRDAIVIDFETTVLNVLPTEVDDPMSGVDSSRVAVDHRKQLNREYVRALLSQSEPRLPAWIEEGIAQIMMAMKISDRVIVFGEIDRGLVRSSAAESIASLNTAAAAEDGDAPMMSGAPVDDLDFNAVLHRTRLIPLEKMFAVPHDAPEARNPLGTNIWAKQSYALVHLCWFGERGRYQKPFAAYLSRIAREPATEAVFRDCFKMSYKDMLLTLRGYVQSTVYTSKEFRAPKGQKIPKPPPLQLRDASQAEIGRIKGEALFLAGQLNAARVELTAPYIRGEHDSDLLAALGLAEQANGNEERARKFLAAAVAGKTTRPEAYVALARYELADAAKNAPATGERSLTREQAAAITAKLLSARQHPPLLPEIYELTLDAWLRSKRAVSKDDLVLLVEGVRQFPGRLRYVYRVAAVCAAAGLNEAAHDLATHGASRANDPQTRAAFESLRAQLPAAAAPSAPAEGATKK